MKYTVRKQGTTLDEIVFNHYGASFNYLEAVLKANPSLAKEGVFLTEGITITLPEIITNTSTSRIKLWE